MDAIAVLAEVVFIIAVVGPVFFLARYYWAEHKRGQRVEVIKREQQAIEHLSLDAARERADLVLRSSTTFRTRLLTPGLAEQFRVRVPYAIYDVWTRFGAVDMPDRQVSIAPDCVNSPPDEVLAYLDPGDVYPDMIAFGCRGTYVVASSHREAVIDVSYDYQGGFVHCYPSFYHWVVLHDTDWRLDEAMDDYYRHDFGL